MNASQDDANKGDMGAMMAKKRQAKIANADLEEQVLELEDDREALKALSEAVIELRDLFFYIGMLANRQSDILKGIEESVDKQIL